MRVTTITVSSQFKRPSQHIDYASDGVFLSLTAEVLEHEDVAVCVKKLQAQCDTLALDHMVEKRTREVSWMKQKSEQMAAAKARSATAARTADLAAKHGGAQCGESF
ncbi:MAG TPA: hypothetical protein VMD97_01875 [Candidatus Aquilonibacter sp.]|nr:hypothetical protein [Candidatus Aquilonibacter sp.]